MRLETLPLLAGLLVALCGLALMADALAADGALGRRERRLRPRPVRHRGGALILGGGLLCLAASLIGRDSWRYSTLAVLSAFVLFGIGLALDRRYLLGRMFGRLFAERQAR